jgi:flagellar biosynthesis protein FlhF
MGVQRFVGANSREAMHQVRLALGDDALILSSQSIAEGVEILALGEDAEPVVATRPEPVTLSPRRAVAAYADQTPAPVAQTAPPVIEPAPADAFAAMSERLLQEMQQMRALFDRTAAPALMGDDALLQALLNAGFSRCLSEELLSTEPPATAASQAERNEWLIAQLAARLPMLNDDAQLLENGGVIALIGPTGVGKTTTTAKLAARYVMRHGADSLALVTTDSFRIGAHEQLRIYAELLGGDVHALGPEDSLDGLLARLSHKRLVIIDTVGMSQRDQRLLQQLNQLGAIGRPLRLMLVLNAASHGDTLEEVVDTYRRGAMAAGVSLRECIVSKCDESPRLGPVLDVLMRHDLRINYVSVGQQVPEDLHLGNARTLAAEALANTRPSIYAASAEVPRSTGQQLDALSRHVLGHGRHLAQVRGTLFERIEDFGLLEDIWRLSELPVCLQSAALSERLAAAPQNRQSARQVLWGADRPVAGATWKMPVLTLDDAGRVHIRPWLAHQLPAGAAPRLDWSDEQFAVEGHLFVAHCARDTLALLQQTGRAWLCSMHRDSRVVHAGQTVALASLIDTGTLHTSEPVRYRGRRITVDLRQLPVTLPGHEHTPLRAWFATLHDPDAERFLGHRYWLAEGDARLLCAQAKIIEQLQELAALPALTVRAFGILGERQGALSLELKLFLASALAALALRLDLEHAEWARPLRSQLLALNGKRITRNPQRLLEALLNLLTMGLALRRVADHHE